MKHLSYSLLTLGILTSVFGLPRVQAAPNFTVSPAIIDLSGLPRDNLHRTLTIQNNENRQLQLFAFVSTLGEMGNDPSAAAGNWIEIVRDTIILGPGEKKEIPFVNRIHLRAKPGIYHAQITFAESSFTRSEAESNVARGESKSIIINTTVQDSAIEQAGLLQFAPTHSIFFKLPIRFVVRAQNSGNVETTPYGDIRLMNRQQEEKAASDINPNKESLAKGESKVFMVDMPEVKMGKYKAVLSLSYGDGSSRLQDTATVWYIPLSFAFIFLTLLIALFITAGYLLTHRHPSSPMLASDTAPLHTGFTIDEPPRP